MAVEISAFVGGDAVNRAEEQADIATDKAVIATTKAGEAAGSAAAALVSENAAEDAKDEAELARDAALVGAGVYATEAAGRAAVADGVAFKVQGTGDVAAYEYRRVDSSSSTLIATYPSKALIDGITGRISDFWSSTDATSDMIALVTDAVGNILLGAYRSDGMIYLRLRTDDPNIIAGVAAAVSTSFPLDWAYDADTDATPMVTDAEGRELLTLNHATRSLVAYGVTVGAPQQIVAVEALPAPYQHSVVDWNALLYYGQSLSIGLEGAPAETLTQPYSNLTFGAGPKSTKAGSTGDNPGTGTVKALVEDDLPNYGVSVNRGETCCSSSANGAVEYAAIENGIDPANMVMFSATAGHGGYTIAQLAFSDAWSQVLKDHISEFLARATAAGKTGRIHAIGYIQGEQDASGGTSQATYYAALLQLQSDAEAHINGLTGLTETIPFILYQTANDAVYSDGAITQAQLDACINFPHRFRFATATYHIPRYSDDVHMEAAGYKWMGRYFGKDAKRFLVDKTYSNFIRPVSAVVIGDDVLVTFKSAYPLTLDADTLALTTDYGFRVVDAGGTVAISSVTIENQRQVRISLSATPSGAVSVRYALDYLGTGLGIYRGGSGNLRDTDPDYWMDGATRRAMYQVCPAFKLTAIKLG